jgi:hypothetical protein
MRDITILIKSIVLINTMVNQIIIQQLLIVTFYL